LLRDRENSSASFAARWASARRDRSASLGPVRAWLVRRKLSRARLLGILERVVVTAVFCHFAFVMLAAYGKAGVLSLILLVSEGLPVVLTLTRRDADTLSDQPVDWLLALIGTTLPLLAVPVATITLAPTWLSGAIMLTGLFVQISAKAILGRSFGLIAANRGIKVAGPYRFVRHPMYGGYTIMHVGCLLGFPSLWNLILYSTQLAIQVARLLREEHLLTQDPSYRDYVAHVRYRLIPMIF
jgi:protein-S-isoprenylcysteine O-methyltransferase Ste14